MRFNQDLCNKHYQQLMRRGKTLDRTQQDPNEIITDGDTSWVIMYDINNNESARTIVDTQNLDIVTKYKWRLSTDGYAMGRDADKTIMLHRILVGAPKGMVVDHINHNTLDNRNDNLRICTNQDNGRNKMTVSNNTSGRNGVSWNKSSKKWMSYITVDSKMIYLGLFVNIADAITARENAENKYFGEYRCKEELA